VSSLPRHAAQEAQKVPSLRELQPQTFKSILDSVGVALVVLDYEGRCVFSNQTAIKMFGATENLSLTEWRRDHKVQDSQGREIPAARALLLRALAGEEVKPSDARVTLPDGRINWFHVAAFPFSVLGLTGVLAVCTDETEQVELREALEQSRRIEAFGVLAGALVHDFNNILSVLSGNIALVQNDRGDQESTRVHLQRMEAAVDKGSALVARLMQYKRQQDTQLRPVHINKVVNATLELARPLLKGKVRVKTELGPCLPVVQADPSQLDQVLLNLILNALDAMPEGGELVLSTSLVSHDVIQEAKNEKKNRFVLITVADTGTGIPEHIRVRIFDPFFTTKPGKGAGLGLSSAQLIIRRHNGHIKVQSAPGAGTIFSIYLPVQS
jgi:PAS domain S-box-containing protein